MFHYQLINFQNLRDADEKVVIFSALKTTSGTGILTFDTTRVNIGEAMTADTGEFKAPFSGTYAFQFFAMGGDKVKTVAIKVMKNESQVFVFFNRFDESSTTRYDNINSHWILSLSAGDIIKLNLNEGNFHPGSSYPATFSGYLLHLDE